MINPIAYSYWRRIKAKARNFAAVPEEMKPHVEQAAVNEIAQGIITREEFETFLGKMP